MTRLTEEEGQYVRENASSMNKNQLAKQLGVSYERVGAFCKREGITPISGHRKCEPDCTCYRHSEEFSQKRKAAWDNPELIEWRRQFQVEKWKDTEYQQKQLTTRRGKRKDGTPAVGYYIHQGYKLLTMQYDHPLAKQDSTLPEHRKVLYDAIGPGPHPCHWCGRSLEWEASSQGGMICVDHLDEDTLNNSRENLAVSCSVCNSHRNTLGLTPYPELES